MRGKGLSHICITSSIRITPAYAGKRPRGKQRKGVKKDHPRVCGEKFKLRGRTFSRLGSPPRMRGKAHLPHLNKTCRGITPAYAGKSACFQLCEKLVWDHPRVCGEKTGAFDVQTLIVGSPPRMRGKGFPSSSLFPHTGITPAYAGKRLKRSRSTVPHAAIVPLFPSVCNKPAGSDGSPAGHDAPPFLPLENAVPASPAYNLRSL